MADFGRFPRPPSQFPMNTRATSNFDPRIITQENPFHPRMNTDMLPMGFQNGRFQSPNPNFIGNRFNSPPPHLMPGPRQRPPFPGPGVMLPQEPPPSVLQQQSLSSKAMNSFPEQNNASNNQVCLGSGNHQSLSDNLDSMQREQDQDWVNSWLDRRKLKKLDKKVYAIKIPDAKGLLQQWLEHLEKLREIEARLLTGCKDMEEWDSEYKIALDMKVSLEQVCAQFYQNVDMDALKCKLEQRSKKRERSKRKRLRDHEEEQQMAQYREKEHERVDNWQNTILSKDLDLKRAKEMKDEADQILSQVRKKKTEGTQTLQLLESLKKLRSLRKERAAQQGLYSPAESDKAFDSKFKQYTKLMKDQLQTYEDEENTLMVMLETEQVETEKKENYMAAKKEESRLRTWKRNACQVLFGPEKKLYPYDPLYPFRQYYSQAEYNVQSFLQIRNEWDMFLVPEGTPGGSKIPYNWVLPNMDKNLIWNETETSRIKESEKNNELNSR